MLGIMIVTAQHY